MKNILLIILAILATNASAITATKAYVDGATNATLVAAKAYTDQHGGGGGGGATTNAVCGIITNHVTSGYLCTVSAAAAMTNALPAWTKAATKPTYTAAEVGARPVDWMPSASDVGALEYDYSRDICDISVRIGGSGFDHSDDYAWAMRSSLYAGSHLRKNEDNRWYYGDGSEVGENEIATIGDLPTPATPAFANAFASKATEGRVTVISNKLDELTGYITGDRVRLSVTNYYGNTSGEPPRLRIEEFDHSTTNVVGVYQVISNFYRIVWDETTRQTNYMQRTDAKVDAISNNVMTAAFRQTNNQLANKSPRAWQTVTSAGEQAPPNVVWHTAPNTVFAGGTEYAHVAVGEGTICVLVDKGASVFTEGAEGQFRFKDQTGQNYFGFDVRQSYTLGCRTDGISVDQSTHIVSLTYDLTSEDNPEVLVCTNLTEGTWGVATVEWEQNPPVGTKICYINCGSAPQGYYQAQMHYAGGSKFITNMQADLQGGIAATNEALNVVQSVYPVITSTGVVWRVKQ